MNNECKCSELGSYYCHKNLVKLLICRIYYSFRPFFKLLMKILVRFSIQSTNKKLKTCIKSV